MSAHVTAVLLSLCSVLLLCAGQLSLGRMDDCVQGVYHKDEPSIESEQFEACGSWQNQASCCSADTTRSLARYGAVQLYNFTWDLCGNLSTECRNYLVNEQCFYFCEPILDNFEIESIPGAISHVPVCASYCEEWFEACREDLTCTDNWLDNLLQAFFEGMNTCPPQSECRTFEEVFRDGRGLCNNMWGSDFFYSDDPDNCTVMEFDPESPNPNLQLTFGAAEKSESSMVFSGALAMLLATLTII